MKKFENPEGATSLDPDELEGLKLKHITTRTELDRWEQENINDAINWLDKRRKSDILSEKFVCQLHQKMFGKVWIWAGTFRRSAKNIGVDWTLIGTHLHQLLGDVRYWIENCTYILDEIGVRFHHRLVAIHLFPNGNGRHARLMTDVLMTDILGQERFTWGNTSLLRDGVIRQQYIHALRVADYHDYEALIKFVRS